MADQKNMSANSNRHAIECSPLSHRIACVDHILNAIHRERSLCDVCGLTEKAWPTIAAGYAKHCWAELLQARYHDHLSFVAALENLGLHGITGGRVLSEIRPGERVRPASPRGAASRSAKWTRAAHSHQPVHECRRIHSLRVPNAMKMQTVK